MKRNIVLGVVMGRIREITRSFVAREPEFYGDLDEEKFCDFIEKIVLKRPKDIFKLMMVNRRELEHRLKEIIFRMEENKMVNFRKGRG